MLAVTVNFTMWDNMIKDRIWFVFMKHLGSSKRSYRAEWGARGPICHLRWYHNSTVIALGHLPSIGSLSYFGLKLFRCTYFEMPPTPPQVRDCRNTWKCGMAHVYRWHSPELGPPKRIQRSTNMSFVLQLQAAIQNCLGARCQLPELLLVYCREWIRLKLQWWIVVSNW